MAAQCLEIAGPIGGVAQRIHEQGDVREADALVEAGSQGDQFGVDVGVVRAGRLRTDLVELAIPTGLRLVVPEARTRIPHLPGRDRPLLGEHPTHRRGEFGTKGDLAAALVFEGVQLLRDDVARLTQTVEDAHVFEHRRNHHAESGSARLFGEHVDQCSHSLGVWRLKVAGARKCLKTRFGHARQRLLPQPPLPGMIR